MNTKTDAAACPRTGEKPSDLAFFSRMCASISHEIKNCLAVINEQNGLHQDLLMLCQQGREPAPGRIEKIAQTIADQVQRMNRIVKRLNRFAHSPDTSAGTIDLLDISTFAVELCQRFAVNKGVTLVSRGEPKLSVQGQAFEMLQMLVGCIEAGFLGCSSGGTLSLEVSSGEGGPEIAIIPALEHTSPSVKSMAESMGCVLVEDGDATRITF